MQDVHQDQAAQNMTASPVKTGPSGWRKPFPASTVQQYKQKTDPCQLPGKHTRLFPGQDSVNKGRNKKQHSIDSMEGKQLSQKGVIAEEPCISEAIQET